MFKAKDSKASLKYEVSRIRKDFEILKKHPGTATEIELNNLERRISRLERGIETE